MITAGIDVGSRFIKAVLWDQRRSMIIAKDTLPQSHDPEMLTRQLLNSVLSRAGLQLDQITRIVTTGYGRHSISFAHKTFTEITCHARGVWHQHPNTRTVIEVGGQDSKFIRLGHRGNVIDFTMNDRCAAGTGRFIEQAASRLGLDIDEFGRVAMQSQKPCQISSMCVVFAETEMTGLIAKHTPIADIAAGILNAIAARINTLTGGAVIPPVAFTGGVAAVPGMATALANVLKVTIIPVQDPFYTGALGAAILAAEEVQSLSHYSTKVRLPERGDLTR